MFAASAGLGRARIKFPVSPWNHPGRQMVFSPPGKTVVVRIVPVGPRIYTFTVAGPQTMSEIGDGVINFLTSAQVAE